MCYNHSMTELQPKYPTEPKQKRSRVISRRTFLSITGLLVGAAGMRQGFKQLEVADQLYNESLPACDTQYDHIGWEDAQKDQQSFIQGIESGINIDGIVTEEEQIELQKQQEKIDPNNIIFQRCVNERNNIVGRRLSSMFITILSVIPLVLPITHAMETVLNRNKENSTPSTQ